MMFEFPLFTLVFFLGGLMAVFYAALMFLRRPTPGSDAFAFFALSIALWVIFRALEAGAVDLSDKIIWGKMIHLGAAFAGPAWLLFTLHYTGSHWWADKHLRLLLFLIPVLSLAAVCTNDQLGWFWTRIYISPGTEGRILVWDHGWAFWIEAIYTYLTMLAGITILCRHLLRKGGVYLKQMTIVLIATLIPVFSNAIYLSGLSPIQGLDLTPFAFAVSGVLFTITIFQLHFLDVVPVARDTLVEKIPDGILVLDRQRIIMDINPSAEKILNLVRRQVIGVNLELVWPELAQHLSVVNGRQADAVFELELFDRILEFSLTPILDAQSKEVGRLMVVRDVSVQRRMEQSLRESQSRYAALVEQSNEGVLIIQNGLIRFANTKICDITGFGQEELIGLSMLEPVLEEDRPFVQERYQKRESGQTVPEIYEVRVRRKDGVIRTVELSIGIILYNGSVAYIVSARDITERKLTQRKLESLYQAEKVLRNSLQVEMEKRNKYTRALVHELNTPLTSILASGELLESEQNDPTLAALISNIRRASFNLKQRIDELIELARGETGILKINPIPVDLASLLREVEKDTRPLADKKGLALAIEAPAGMPPVQADPVRLRQVLFNLISNAVKFTGTGRVDVKVTLSPDFVEVSVADTGRGISPEEMENLFDPYRRKVNEGQELGGLGIGLTLSKMYIELQGGRIEVESEVGRGSLFRFTVPVIHSKF